MKYRKFGNSNFDVSVLSFGARCLPLTNEVESIRMIHYAVDHGVNYLDLGYPYDLAEYERLAILVDKALQGNYRQKIKIAVTVPISLMNSQSDLDRYVEKQLRLLKMDKVDFCVLGELNRESWPKANNINVLSWAEEAMKNGRIDMLGFSFHDDFQFLRNIIEAYSGWSFCQFQFSFMDADHHPGISGIRYAAQNGLAVIATHPFKEGSLIKEPPEPVAKIWESFPKKRSLVEWCLRWVWDHPEVSTVVVEMSEIKQVLENVELADLAEPNSLTVQELVLFNKVKDAYTKLKPINCAVCRCCMPCPLSIDVPRILELYNDAAIYESLETSRFHYKAEQHKADACTECGKCVDACPRKIPIIEWLKEAARKFLG
ncbi:MAG: aldo/keto reductase [Nitrososphaerota archaeon]|nr:aldo/keto reductase [Candidatus Bathyarchaeota archaeon]MDW8023751.1 aldo/keto reductase [Nitrososphaerota archaeon]